METLTMTKTLLLELPEEVEQQLLVQAHQLNLSLPKFVLQSLTQWLSWNHSVENDPLRPLLGTLSCEVHDVGANHDFYLNQSCND